MLEYNYGTYSLSVEVGYIPIDVKSFVIFIRFTIYKAELATTVISTDIFLLFELLQLV